MNLKNIILIAERLGWKVSLTHNDSEISYLDFHWILRCGQLFSFTIEWNESSPSDIIEELSNVESSFKHDRVIEDILEGIINLTPSKYFILSREIEELHSRIWVLWLNLSYEFEKADIFCNPNSFCWN